MATLCLFLLFLLSFHLLNFYLSLPFYRDILCTYFPSCNSSPFLGYAFLRQLSYIPEVAASPSSLLLPSVLMSPTAQALFLCNDRGLLPFAALRNTRCRVADNQGLFFRDTSHTKYPVVPPPNQRTRKRCLCVTPRRAHATMTTSTTRAVTARCFSQAYHLRIRQSD